MQWVLNIPKILHVYWGGGPLPYLRYRTVDSFLKHNPEWKVMLWIPSDVAKVVTWKTQELDYECNWTDYTHQLYEIVSEINEVDFNQFNISNSTSEVHKSDFLRYFLLWRYGGVYSDMDIVYRKSITALAVNQYCNAEKDTFVCISPRYGHSIGFLMASAGSDYFYQLMNLSKNAYKDPAVYQCIGATLCNHYFPSIKRIPSAIDIGMEAVYAYDARKIKALYDLAAVERITPRSIGIHWFAGHRLAGEFLRSTDGGRINLPNNIVGRL